MNDKYDSLDQQIRPSWSEVSLESIRSALPAEVPTGVAATIKNYLNQAPLAFNTDWIGTMAMFGLLKWARRGVPGALDFARAWFEAHLHRDPKLTDEEFDRTYTGALGSRVVRTRHLPISMYSGLFGLAFPCHELYLQTKDVRAREVLIDVADAILHMARRHGNGLFAHDDRWQSMIPDACFFAVEPLMRAATVSGSAGASYVEQAVYQLRLYIDLFLDRQKGLARTMAFEPDWRLGKTYWCRATGWLAWSIAGVLRSLPRDHPAYQGFVADFRVLAAGVARAIGEQGSLHAYTNDPSSPPESSGTAMVATVMHEGVRKGWLPSDFSTVAARMWQFIRDNVTDSGSLQRVYRLWAEPAEQGEIDIYTESFGPHIGALLWLADEFTTTPTGA